MQIKKIIKNAFKKFKAEPNAKNLSEYQSEIDKAVKKDLLKKNTASRRKAVAAKIAKDAAGVKATAKPAAKKAAAKPAAKPAAKKTAAKKAPAKKPAAKKTATKATK